VATVSIEALIAEGKLGLADGDAERARRAFQSALRQRETGELLEGLARALYLRGDYPESIEAHERACAAYRQEGDATGAARAARHVAWLRNNVYGDPAVFQGWLARASRLLEGEREDSPEHGWIELMRSREEPLAETRQQLLRSAIGLGRRFADLDLEYMAIGKLGYTLVLLGRIEEGMLMLDESLAAVCAGEVDELFVVESTFCSMFQACERAQDVTRAEQWLRTAEEMAQRRNLAPVAAFCRAHYAGILTAAGRWEEAECELERAARIFGRSYPANGAGVRVRLADLRVRQGRLEEAEVLLEGLDHHPDVARPLAALHAARGETALARDLLESKLADPLLDPVAAASLLTLLVDVQLADGDVREAAGTSERLAELVAAQHSDYLRACAALTKGKVCLASGSGDARRCLREALAAFSLAEMPVELARARLELAKAAAEEQPEVAVAEAKKALEAFELRHAARDADAAAALLRSLGAAGRTAPKRRAPLTKRESEVLELLGHGLSNPEIAERLFISAKTAEHHVGRILAKLGLRNRAEAAAYAWRAAGPRSESE
jgi:DNA-binding NarL/FixJ family response regulator